MFVVLILENSVGMSTLGHGAWAPSSWVPGPRLGVASRSSDMVLIYLAPKSPWPHLHRPGDCGGPQCPPCQHSGNAICSEWRNDFSALTGSHRL